MLKGFLAGLMVVGAVSSAVGASGVIAPSTDTAMTGNSSPEYAVTGVFPPLVDLKLATWDGTACGTFTDNLDSPLFAVNSGVSRSIDETRTLCVRNDGTMATGLRISVTSMSGSDPSCSPDEIQCANGMNQEFELRWSITKPGSRNPATCPALTTAYNGTMSIVSGRVPNGGETAVGVTLPVGVSCRYDLRVYNTALPYSAQTDALSWRFRVDTI